MKGAIPMGIFKAILGSTEGVLADQWKEYFFCNAMPQGVIGMRGRKHVSERGVNTESEDNVITDGSLIVVAEGQMAIAVEQGKAFAAWTEPGEYRFDSALSGSMLSGSGVKNMLHQIGERVAFGGEAPIFQRIYFFSSLESGSMEFHTPQPIPFRVTDENIKLDAVAGVHCEGSFTYRLKDPVKFYNTVCGGFSDTYEAKRLHNQMESECLTSLQTALGQLADQGMRASELPSHTDTLCELLTTDWLERRGFELFSVGLTLHIVEEDFDAIQQLQAHAPLRDPAMAAATLAGAQSAAMQSAAENTAGAAFASAAVVTSSSLIDAIQGKKSDWTCSCGQLNTGKFCQNCGAKRPE